tara:strand:+ start:1618 stop:1947 length:330 start_codon:yes stop_codon:yes gene_type:complete
MSAASTSAKAGAGKESADEVLPSPMPSPEAKTVSTNAGEGPKSADTVRVAALHNLRTWPERLPISATNFESNTATLATLQTAWENNRADNKESATGRASEESGANLHRV